MKFILFIAPGMLFSNHDRQGGSWEGLCLSQGPQTAMIKLIGVIVSTNITTTTTIMIMIIIIIIIIIIITSACMHALMQ